MPQGGESRAGICRSVLGRGIRQVQRPWGREEGGGQKQQAGVTGVQWGGERVVPGKASPFPPRGPGNRGEGTPQGHWLRCGEPTEASGGRPRAGARAGG